jgi:hypothetical protein
LKQTKSAPGAISHTITGEWLHGQVISGEYYPEKNGTISGSGKMTVSNRCPVPTLAAGALVDGFRVLRVLQIPEIRITAYEDTFQI